MICRRNNRTDAARAIEGRFKDHVTKDRPSRTFEFRHRNGSSAYAFSLIWTPGTLALAGDCGELTLTHYNALWKLEEGLVWATSPGCNYLLGKSDKREELDRAATFQFIREYLTQGALGSLKRLREERQDWLKEKPTRKTHRRNGKYWRALLAWRKEKPRLEFETKTMHPWDHGYRLSKVPISIFESRDTYTEKHAPDGWERWHLLRQEMCDHLPDDAIFTSAGRREILRNLEYFLDESGPDHISDLTYGKLDFDDYGYSSDYSCSAYQQIMTIQWAARRALDWLEGERVYAWNDPADMAAAA